MTTIKATCPTCGEVSLTPEDIELRVDETCDDGSFYGFSCPQCRTDVRKPADERVVRLLVSGGVPALPAQAPALHRRLSERATGPALTHDDLLDFHHALQDDGWLAAQLDRARG